MRLLDARAAARARVRNAESGRGAPVEPRLLPGLRVPTLRVVAGGVRRDVPSDARTRRHPRGDVRRPRSLERDRVGRAIPPGLPGRAREARRRTEPRPQRPQAPRGRQPAGLGPRLPGRSPGCLCGTTEWRVVGTILRPSAGRRRLRGLVRRSDPALPTGLLLLLHGDRHRAGRGRRPALPKPARGRARDLPPAQGVPPGASGLLGVPARQRRGDGQACLGAPGAAALHGPLRWSVRIPSS